MAIFVCRFSEENVLRFADLAVKAADDLVHDLVSNGLLSIVFLPVLTRKVRSIIYSNYAGHDGGRLALNIKLRVEENARVLFGVLFQIRDGFQVYHQLAKRKFHGIEHREEVGLRVFGLEVFQFGQAFSPLRVGEVTAVAELSDDCVEIVCRDGYIWAIFWIQGTLGAVPTT
jgi:hypothetical protein